MADFQSCKELASYITTDILNLESDDGMPKRQNEIVLCVEALTKVGHMIVWFMR